MHRVHSDEISRKAKRALWDEIIQDYLSSDERAGAYCERHGLKSDHLYYYVSSYRRKQRSVQPFIPVEAPAMVNRPSSIEFTLGSLQVSLPSDISLALLDSVLKRMLQC